jgi:hypothetical protein
LLGIVFGLGIVCGLAAGIVLGTVSTLAVVRMHGRSTDQPGGGTDAGATKPNAANMTKPEFRKKMDAGATKPNAANMTKAEFRKKMDDFLFRVTEVKHLHETFGRPTRTSTIGGKTRWYYACQDGTIELNFAFASPLEQPNDRVMVTEINDF